MEKDPRQILKLAGTRTLKEIDKLISEVEEILDQEQIDGLNKLKPTIPQIRSDPYGQNYFVDGKIAYLPPKGQAIVIGDTHADSFSTENILRKTDFMQRAKEGEGLYLIALGDYIDRGRNDARNLEILFSLKENYPDNVILEGGNHERYPSVSDLPLYLGRYYGFNELRFLYQRYMELFLKLPMATVTGNGIVAVHGGVPTYDTSSLYDLRDSKDDFLEICWNDPSDYIEWKGLGDRGIGFEFGRSIFTRFMDNIGANLMIRGHKYYPLGYRLFFENRLASIFSTGTGSEESFYQNKVVPKFIEVFLEEPILRFDPKKHIKEVYPQLSLAF